MQITAHLEGLAEEKGWKQSMWREDLEEHRRKQQEQRSSVRVEQPKIIRTIDGSKL